MSIILGNLAQKLTNARYRFRKITHSAVIILHILKRNALSTQYS